MLSSAASTASSMANFSPPNHHHVWNLFLSLPVLVVLRILAKSTPYAKQGFFCHDLEIRFPYVKDTVPANMLDWVFAVGATLAVISSECSLVRHLTRRNCGKRLHRGDALFHPLAINCLYFIAAFFCSNLCTSSICNLGKRTASRLRPNFLAVCQPKNLSALCPPDKFDYVTDYVCTNEFFDQNEYFSFPSGHAAHVCNFAVFFIFYLQKRCKLPPMLRSFAQFFIALFAYFVCLSRVRDHKHRLTDVMGGALTGMALGAFFVRFVLINFRPNRYSLVDRSGADCWPDDVDQSSQPIIGQKFSVSSVIVQQNGNNGSRGVGEKSTMLGKGSASDYGSLVASSLDNVFVATGGNSAGAANDDLEAGIRRREEEAEGRR